MNYSITYFLVSILTLLPGKYYNISAQEPIRIKRITDQVKFDGIPDENFWNTLDTFSMTMWRPTFGTNPTESSDIRIGYDDEYLWVAARIYMKDASKIFIPTMKRDETLWDYDAFGIIIDSYNDNENGSAFFTNPAGLRSDFSISNDGSFAAGAMPTNSNWDTFWDVKTSRDNKGWYLEMRIPFSSLKFKTENGIATMGIILNRSISSNSETDLYPAIDVKYGYSAFIKPSGAQKIIIEGPGRKGLCMFLHILLAVFQGKMC
jgi:Carbohydrate family 9 binding domain-like